MNVEVVLLDEAAGGCSSFDEQFGDDVAGSVSIGKGRDYWGRDQD